MTLVSDAPLPLFLQLVACMQTPCEPSEFLSTWLAEPPKCLLFWGTQRQWPLAAKQAEILFEPERRSVHRMLGRSSRLQSREAEPRHLSRDPWSRAKPFMLLDDTLAVTGRLGTSVDLRALAFLRGGDVQQRVTRQILSAIARPIATKPICQACERTQIVRMLKKSLRGRFCRCLRGTDRRCNGGTLDDHHLAGNQQRGNAKGVA